MNNKNRNSDKTHELYRAILELKTPEECYNFFVDLCTVSELKAMEQRFQVARMLSRGMIYHEILEQTGASSATISRVNRALNYGCEGYNTVMSRLDEADERIEEDEYDD